MKTAGPDGSREALKVFLVETLSKIDTVLSSLADPATIRILLHERNKSVEKVFDKALLKTPPPTSIAIFYGAEHQMEIQATLTKRYGYKMAEQRWITFAKADRKKIDAAGRQLLEILEKAAASGF